MKVQSVVLLGEGTFHQYHGGVTTGGVDTGQREALIEAFREQYREIRGDRYRAPKTDPVYLGKLPDAAVPALQQSVHKRMEFMSREDRD